MHIRLLKESISYSATSHRTPQMDDMPPSALHTVGATSAAMPAIRDRASPWAKSWRRGYAVVHNRLGVIGKATTSLWYTRLQRPPLAGECCPIWCRARAAPFTANPGARFQFSFPDRSIVHLRLRLVGLSCHGRTKEELLARLSCAGCAAHATG